MRGLWIAGLVALGMGSWVSAEPLTLAEALAYAELRSVWVNATIELNQAELALGRALADPLALRPDRVQAEQRRTLAAARAERAALQAALEMTQAYIQALEAQRQAELAAQAEALAAQVLAITQVRVANGSATELELREAENRHDEAVQNRRAAEEGAALARVNLASMIGRSVEAIAPLPERRFALPERSAVLAALSAHPDLIEVRQALELAELGLELADPSYTPQAQIEQAQSQRDQAATFAAEAERGLRLQAESLYNQAVSSQEAWRIAAEAAENARRRLDLEAQRFAGGLIAEVTLRQAELEAAQAALRASQAYHRYLLALFELRVGTMVPLEVPDALR